MRLASIIAAASWLALCVGLAVADETNIETRGKIDVSADVPLVAVSTDPVVQRVLNDDFYAAKRGPGVGIKAPATLTVTLTERLLKPGVSLNEVAPGDPAVVALLRAAGANPPPLGDTGSRPVDPYEAAARIENVRPEDPGMQNFRQQQAFQQAINGGGPATNAQEMAENQSYDQVIIARVTVGGQNDRFTVVAIAHPGDDIRNVKRLVAEDIANAALH